MTRLRKLLHQFRNNGLVIADQVVLSGGNFLLGIVLTRNLGLEVFGKFSLLWMIVLFALSLNQAFITKPLLSLAPQQGSATYLPAVHSLQILFSLALTLFLMLALWIAKSLHVLAISNSVLLLISFLAGVHLVYDFCRKYFFLKGKAIWPFVLDSLYHIWLFSTLGAICFFGEWAIEFLLSSMLLAQIIILFFAMYNLPPQCYQWTSIKQVIFQHYDYAKWLIATALLQWFSGNYFLLAAAAILGPLAVGAIRMAQNVIGLLHVLFLSMENIVPIKAADFYYREGLGALKKYLQKITLQIGLITISLLVVVATFAPAILQVIYGAEQVEYSGVLVGFCGVYLLVFLAHPLRYALRTIQKTKPVFLAYLWGTVFSLLMAYPLVERFALYGVLAGLLLTQLISVSIYFYYLWKKGFFYENYSFGTR